MTCDLQALGNIPGLSTIPVHIMTTSLRPDIVLYSNEKKKLVFLELTVPMERYIADRHKTKIDRYTALTDECQLAGWETHNFAIEVGVTGMLSSFFQSAFSRLGTPKHLKARLYEQTARSALYCSYVIFLHRKDLVWTL